ncbi:MAG TPA: folylpolyglutamate synthase/dihydrofolate synthase family protein [Chloroflexota bacterium]
MNYQDALGYLQTLTDFEKKTGYTYATAGFDLRRPRALLEVLGNPQLRFPSIVVAGTKGKGSTSAMIASILRASGRSVGLYSQPHLHTFRERIRVDDTIITPEEFASAVEAVVPVVEEFVRRYPDLGMPTSYEAATAAALVFFARKAPDIVVLEVGLGGRLDAVNVVEPLVSVITPVSLDHVQILGNTVAEIASEKAGIIKERGVVVAAEQDEEAMGVIRRVARERSARLIEARPDVAGPAVPEDGRPEIRPGEHARPRRTSTEVSLRGTAGAVYRLRLPLLGAHQVANAATAIAVIEQLEGMGVVAGREAIEAGLASVKWPGRLEVVSEAPLVVVDGAHNGDSARKLAAALTEEFLYRRLILVLGTSTDKDVEGIIAALGPIADIAIATRSRHPRAADPERLAAELRRHSHDVRLAPDVPKALSLATGLADSADLICATGSLFTVADARDHYGLAVDKD